MSIALNQYVIFMQVYCRTRHQKPVNSITGPGQPQAAAAHLKTKAFRGVDQAELLGHEHESGRNLMHGVAPWVRPYCPRLWCLCPDTKLSHVKRRTARFGAICTASLGKYLYC